MDKTTPDTREAYRHYQQIPTRWMVLAERHIYAAGDYQSVAPV